jgi:hypothetical protein
MESLCSEIYDAYTSDKMQVGAAVPRAVEVSILLSPYEHSRRTESLLAFSGLLEGLHNWLVQGTFFGFRMSRSIYIGYYGL